MKRSGFKRPAYSRPAPSVPVPLARRGAPVQIADAPVQVLKEQPVRSEAYRRLVAALPCAMCGRPGPSQAAHPNTGKGLALKACDLLAFPLCADRPGEIGCHMLFDQGAMFDKLARRVAEVRWGRQTQERIMFEGSWPAGLERPAWALVPA